MLLLISTLLICEISAFQQSDYNLTSERLEVAAYDRKWMVPKIKNFKYNRSLAVANITFNVMQDLVNPEGVVQAKRFASNEYRPFPISFEMPVCEVLAKNDFGMQNTFKCGNFRGCPVKKNRYEICNWIPDESQFPPHIPSGRYLIELQILSGSEQAVLVHWYVKVEKRFRYV